MVERSRSEYERIGGFQGLLNQELKIALGSDESLVNRAMESRTAEEVMNFRKLNAEGVKDFAHKLAERARQETGIAPDSTALSETPTSTERNEQARQRAHLLAIEQMKAVQQEQPPELTRSEKLDAMADIAERRSFIRKLPSEYPELEEGVLPPKYDMETLPLGTSGREYFMDTLEQNAGSHAQYVMDNYVPDAIKGLLDQIGDTEKGAAQLRKLSERYVNLFNEAVAVRKAELEMQEEMRKLMPEIRRKAAALKSRQSPAEAPARIERPTRPVTYQEDGEFDLLGE